MLVLTVSGLPPVSLNSADPVKILPTILTQLSLNEKKRQINAKQEAAIQAKKAKRKEIFSKAILKNVALKVAYLGWEYNGLARQINTPETVEEVVLQGCERCCLIYSAQDYKITRCGRTDKGVSAFSQVVSLYMRSKIDDSSLNGKMADGKVPEEYDYITMLNNVLPPFIRVLAWAPVGLEFDARFQVLYRSYKYFFPRCDLDIEAMRGALGRFLGEHNFRAFCKADRTLEEPNFNRTITYLSIDPVSEDTNNPALSVYSLTILGHAFLWHQIRNMVCVLLRIGLGLESSQVISGMLSSGVKYNYGMASDLPLVLFECEFENVEWNTSKVDLSKLWFEFEMKSTLIKQLMCKELVSVRNVGVLCDTKQQSIMSRPFIS